MAALNNLRTVSFGCGSEIGCSLCMAYTIGVKSETIKFNAGAPSSLYSFDVAHRRRENTVANTNSRVYWASTSRMSRKDFRESLSP